ncbi:FRG domain-containing protein [Thalassococcus sp. BH17M4-6]|uniref:FRG domain-containing protein n=1 Tax=Thalassococcus sp. BH17M4-6 TaxID=3413148 RepID=UPI003BD2EB83
MAGVYGGFGVMEEQVNSLSGQWMGRNIGDPSSLVVIDLDAVKDRACGSAYLFPEDDRIPASFAKINVVNEFVEFSIEEDVGHFVSDLGYFPTWTELGERFPDIDLPTKVTATFSPIDQIEAKLTWETNKGTGGSVALRRKSGDDKSSLASEAEVTNWNDFQKYVSDLNPSRLVYRGQSEKWSLKTSFHRTRRRDLNRYLSEDIPRLQRATSSRLRHVFDLSKPFENGAFMNLAQHHGFPTPLLDWTYSPYIAAYFAYSGVTDKHTGAIVRIYAFDIDTYTEKFPQHQTLTFMRPHFSFLEALSIENDRAIPQQGLLSLTNLENIEEFIEYQERSGNRYLHAFDLPVEEKDKALSDLRLMGITKSTLFPGLDSICEELRHRYF